MTPMASARGRSKFDWVKGHSLSIALVVVLILQSWAFYKLRLPEWVADQRDHGIKSPKIWPDFWAHYWGEYMVSILADTYGALILVLFSKWFFEKGSMESRDPDESTGAAQEA